MAKPWKSIPRKSKFYEIIVTRDGTEYFRTMLTGDAAGNVQGIFWALKREYPEKDRFDIHAYETNSVRHLILGPGMIEPVVLEGPHDTELYNAMDILQQVVGSNQTAQEALEILVDSLPIPEKDANFDI